MNHETALSNAKEIANTVLAPAARQNDKDSRFLIGGDRRARAERLARVDAARRRWRLRLWDHALLRPSPRACRSGCIGRDGLSHAL